MSTSPRESACPSSRLLNQCRVPPQQKCGRNCVWSYYPSWRSLSPSICESVAANPAVKPPAYGGRLTLIVSPITRFMRAPTCSSAPPCSKGFQAFWAPSACAASATSYPSCSAAPLSWRSAFSWAEHVFKAGRSLLAFGSNCSSQPTAYGGG